MEADLIDGLEPLPATPLAAAGGVLGMLCLTIWPLFRKRGTILTVQLGTGLGFTLHDTVVGAWTGAAMNGLGMLLTALAIPIATRPGFRRACYALLPVIAVATAVTWQGGSSLLPALGSTLVTLGRLQTDTITLRALILAGGLALPPELF